jgi:hypothetical protein
VFLSEITTSVGTFTLSRGTNESKSEYLILTNKETGSVIHTPIIQLIDRDILDDEGKIQVFVQDYIPNKRWVGQTHSFTMPEEDISILVSFLDDEINDYFCWSNTIHIKKEVLPTKQKGCAEILAKGLRTYLNTKRNAIERIKNAATEGNFKSKLRTEISNLLESFKLFLHETSPNYPNFLEDEIVRIATVIDGFKKQVNEERFIFSLKILVRKSITEHVEILNEDEKPSLVGLSDEGLVIISTSRGTEYSAEQFEFIDSYWLDGKVQVGITGPSISPLISFDLEVNELDALVAFIYKKVKKFSYRNVNIIKLGGDRKDTGCFDKFIKGLKEYLRTKINVINEIERVIKEGHFDYNLFNREMTNLAKACAAFPGTKRLDSALVSKMEKGIYTVVDYFKDYYLKETKYQIPENKFEILKTSLSRTINLQLTKRKLKK